MVYIYFIRAGKLKKDPIKIGLAKNIEKRLADLQVANPYQLQLIMAFPTNSRKHAEMVEKRLHRYFKHKHIRGEWFLGDIDINKCLKKNQKIEIDEQRLKFKISLLNQQLKDMQL